MTKLRVGDWVEVRSKEEILQTLDKNGRLEELPFMPQMFQYCGKRFPVYARAHKTCDVVNGGSRRLRNGVHLYLRCDGQAYDGCQASCLLFWKDAWLKPVEGPARGAARSDLSPHDRTPACTEADVWKATRVQNAPPGPETVYVCQATNVTQYTTFLPWWDLRQYVEDYTSGNASLGRMLRGCVYMAYNHGTQAWRRKIGRPGRWVYDRFQAIWGGIPFPRRKGTRPPGVPAPHPHLNLQAGELVRVKSYEEILATVDEGNMHGKLLWDAELVPYCGGVYRVKTRISKFVSEHTGRMVTMKTPALMLEDVWCRSRYSECKMFCARSIYSWWREAWLERVPDGSQPLQPDAPAATSSPSRTSNEPVKV
jgi:hypothetical protein